MYKLLLATDHPAVMEMCKSAISWAREGFSEPIIVSTAEEAIAVLKTIPIDAIGFHLSNSKADPLINYLQDERASLPIFTVYMTANKELEVLTELKKLLNRMHADFADEVYDEKAMMDMVREEMLHSLLAGEILKKEILERWLQLIRSHIAYNEPCMLFELDMPQGEVYLSDHWHHGQDRLENALRSNFFNRYANDIYYGVAVLSNRHIRVVAIQKQGFQLPIREFAEAANAHVNDTIESIKEYLDLDICLLESGMLSSLNDFIDAANDQ